MLNMSSEQFELSKLTSEELKQLCNSTSTDKYDELVNQSDQVKTLENQREMLMASVRSLAEFNLLRQSDYESDRKNLLVSICDTNKIKEDIKEKANKLVELSKIKSLDSTLAVVLKAASRIEDESENVAQDFLNKLIDYEKFLSDYKHRRALAHMRRIKAERLRIQLASS